MLAYAKLDELLAVHKEHPETRNHYFTDKYNELQREQSEAETTRVFEAAFGSLEMTEDDIPRLVEMIHGNIEPDMDHIAAGSTFNAMEAFYKVGEATCTMISQLISHQEFSLCKYPRAVHTAPVSRS